MLWEISRIGTRQKSWGGSFICPSCELPRKRSKYPLTSTCAWCVWKKTALSDTRIEGVPDRIASKVELTPDCWLWLGTLNDRGYGTVGVPGGEIVAIEPMNYSPSRKDDRMRLAHRIIYELLVGPIPKGYHLHHRETCPHNCVNPAHMTPMTPGEHSRLHPDNARSNWERMRSRTHCKRGHEFTPENTRIRRGTTRVCRICQREDQRVSQPAYRARNKEKV